MYKYTNILDLYTSPVFLTV